MHAHQLAVLARCSSLQESVAGSNEPVSDKLEFAGTADSFIDGGDSDIDEFASIPSRRTCRAVASAAP